MSPAALSEIESGETVSLRGRTLTRLADVYGSSPEYIQSGTGQPFNVVARTPDEAELLNIYRALRERALKAGLLAAARGMLAGAGTVSASQPFGSLTPPKVGR
jgi:transcriptional regulator with XRE-family HTH domain